jgi:hypothetical protein
VALGACLTAGGFVLTLDQQNLITVLVFVSAALMGLLAIGSVVGCFKVLRTREAWVNMTTLSLYERNETLRLDLAAALAEGKQRGILRFPSAEGNSNEWVN